MSRYVILDAPEAEIVIGFDPPLRAFFGQRFDARRERVTSGHPGRYGLGTEQESPRLETVEDAARGLLDLLAWAIQHGAARDQLAGVAGRLLREWREDPGAISTPYRLLRPALNRPGGVYIEGDHVQKVCRLGQDVRTCRFLSAGRDGFLCEKHSGLGPVLQERAEAGTIGALGDNCPGLRARADTAAEAMH